MAPVNVMLNGLPGNVITVIARHALTSPEVAVVPVSLTGPEIEAATCTVADTAFELVRPANADQRLSELVDKHRPLIAVDFTHPTAVNANAELYCRHGLPFVMGTTGGDRQALVETVRRAAIAAVIAPNMAKQIVGFQAMLAYAADTFPGLFNGYRLEVRESHQRGKADTSGTAKAVVAAFNRLGVPFDVADIHKERDPEIQQHRWGIPQAHLDGHGWHTYTLVSTDGTVRFEFTHNVNGREIYAPGALDAVRFLTARIAQGASGRVFSMIDVLKG